MRVPRSQLPAAASKGSCVSRARLEHVAAVAALCTCMGALWLASTVAPSHTGGMHIPGFQGKKIAQPGSRSLAQPKPEPSFQVLFSPRPTPPPPRYNLRRCVCDNEWLEKKDSGVSVCTCSNTECPAYVNPPFLTAALGQDVCSLKKRTGYNCYVRCEGSKVLWFAEACGGENQAVCDDLVVTPTPTPSQSPSAKPTIVVPRTTWDPTAVYDFRGGGCELLNGEKRCYMEDRQGRELCPKHITLEYLQTGPPELPQCLPSNSHQYYCTIQCQDGNDDVRWGVHDIEDCHTRANFGNCPPRPTVVPISQFQWREWTEPRRPATRCQLAAADGKTGAFVADLSVGLLTHEPRSFRDSMNTYVANGLFDVVDDFIIFINNRNDATDAVAAEFQARYPGKIRVLGDATNVGIARGLVALTSAARHAYFLFLERDFQLIEPQTCVSEQLSAGIALVRSGAAQVVRYRSRWRAGRPNWAVRFFHGHEDDAWDGWQPNLGCNTHYWIEQPATRWPQYVWPCGADPEMLCSDSFYCNWTNNPQLWALDWWEREYVTRFDAFQRVSPWDDLESYMNWEPGSWNDRGFIVAQGDGLFKHMDRRNIVHV